MVRGYHLGDYDWTPLSQNPARKRNDTLCAAVLREATIRARRRSTPHPPFALALAWPSKSRFQMDAILTYFSRYDIPAPAATPANLPGELPRYASPVVVVGRLASTGCQRPAAKRDFSRRVWPPTPRGSLAPLGTMGTLGSLGTYVYAQSEREMIEKYVSCFAYFR